MTQLLPIKNLLRLPRQRRGHDIDDLGAIKHLLPNLGLEAGLWHQINRARRRTKSTSGITSKQR